jgi:hypothetical protein
MKPEDVIRKFRHEVLTLTKREPRRPQLRNPEDIAIARKFLAWCEGKLVDPLRMVEMRVAHMWKQHKRTPAFRSLQADHLVRFAQRAEAGAAAAATRVETFDQTVRDLTRILPNHEHVRRRYCFQQATDLCLQNPMAGGFDPRSHYCPSCPQAAACAKQLNDKWHFDVVSLRRGKLEAVPVAVRKALRGWDGGLSV